LLSLVILILSTVVLCAQSSFVPRKIIFTGLRKTKRAIVAREIPFSVGTPILVEDTARFFQTAAYNIFNTRLFNYVQCRVDSLQADSSGHSTGIVRIQLHERWYTFPSPIFELADRNFNEWWYDRNADLRRVNLGVRFLQKNVRGRNEDLTLIVQGGFTRKLDVTYFFPYIDRRQTWGLKLSGSFANNKDVAVRSVGNRLIYRRDEESFGRERWMGNLQFSHRKSIYGYHYIDFFYQYNRISDFIAGYNDSYFSKGLPYQRYGEVRYSFLADRRNVRYFATRGYAFSAMAGRIGLLPADNFNLWYIRGTLATYKAVSERLYFASRVEMELSNPQNQPYLGTRSLGYENRFVRGYERYIMEGAVNGYSRNTLRYKILGRKFNARWVPLKQFQFVPLDVYITAFGDAGVVQNPHVLPENKRLVNTILAGYGLGINIVSFYDVVFRAEYSRNIHHDSGVYFSFLTDI